MLKEPTYPIRPPQFGPFPSHVQWSGDNAMFTPAECDSIIRAGESCEQGFAMVGNGNNSGGAVNLEYRTVKSCCLWREASGMDLTWVYERIAAKVDAANRDFFRFDLTGIGEGIQFLKYEVFKDKPSGHYLWHQDFGGGLSSNRKLSLVVNLSDPRDYDGCQLEVFTEKAWASPYVNRGEAIVFPSWTSHQVTLITRGTRYALAVWIHGPQFR